MKVVMHTNIKNFCCERGRMTANGRQVDVNAIKTFLDAIWIFLQSKKNSLFRFQNQLEMCKQSYFYEQVYSYSNLDLLQKNFIPSSRDLSDRLRPTLRMAIVLSFS